MDERLLRRWLADIRRGRRTPRQLIDALARWPTDDLGWARLDTHRALRRGYPEVVLAEGKTADQLTRITRRLSRTGSLVLLTRVQPDVAQQLQRSLRFLRYDPASRLAYRAAPKTRPHGLVVVVSGGTSDMPVAEEAAVTLGLLGSRVARLYDVGVAGIHRVLAQWRLLRRAKAIVVVAGMEGALASVVAGLVACPVVAVPTSIGYGASFQGLAPLLAMMNSCVPGVGVVNIDNGFGAACLAHAINRPARTR